MIICNATRARSTLRFYGTWLGAALSVCGCAGSDDMAALMDDDPSTRRVIDYDTPDAPYVAEFANPDFVPEGELGQLLAPWQSTKYHGGGAGNGTIGTGPCYGAGTHGHDCWFPPSKKIRVVPPSSSSLPCVENENYILSQGGTAAEIAAIKSRFADGLNSLNGIGTGVIVSTTSSAGTTTTITQRCFHAGTAFGQFTATFPAEGSSGGVTLPAFSGVDPIKARTYIANQSFLDLSIENIWDYVVNVCGFTSLRLQRMKDLAFYTGVHEGLHMLGFSHFQGGIMAPSVACGFGTAIAPGFGSALGFFDTASGSATIIENTSLAGQGVPSTGI